MTDEEWDALSPLRKAEEVAERQKRTRDLHMAAAKFLRSFADKVESGERLLISISDGWTDVPRGQIPKKLLSIEFEPPALEQFEVTSYPVTGEIQEYTHINWSKS